METKVQKIARLARLLRIREKVASMRKVMENGKKVTVEDKGKEVKAKRVIGTGTEVTKESKIAMIKQKIATIRKAIAKNTSAVKRAQDGVNSVLENAEDTLNTDLADKNYAVTQPKVEVADAGDLNKSKSDALDQLPDTMMAEDIRSGYKKAIGLIWNKMGKNLEGEHILKATLFELMEEVKIPSKIAIGVIEAAFNRSGSEFLAAVLKRADEIVGYRPEVIAQMAAEDEQTTLIIPDATVTIEVGEGADLSELEEGLSEEDDTLDRIVEGSFRVPKPSRRTSSGSLLSKAVPRYQTSK